MPFFFQKKIIKLRFNLTDNKIIELLGKLKLKSGRKLFNACILLFAKDPQKYFSNAIIKIGKFISDTDIISSDIVKGNLFEQIEQTIDILRTKYLFSKISYEGIHRREKLEFPEDALREAILNSIIHRRYSTTSAIQIRVYDDKLVIMNEGKLPPEVPLEKLKTNHLSKPGNILIAEMFYNAGYVEIWGRGTLKILEQCKQADLPEPVFTEEHGVITITFYKNKPASMDLNKLDLNDRQIKALEYLKEHEKITNSEYQKINSVKKRTTTNDITELVKKNIIEKIGTTGKGTYYVLKGH
jgi:ATP-dependent DNA helicase RecG